jgi:hypothetical protein
MQLFSSKLDFPFGEKSGQLVRVALIKKKLLTKSILQCVVEISVLGRPDNLCFFHLKAV